MADASASCSSSGTIENQLASQHTTRHDSRGMLPHAEVPARAAAAGIKLFGKVITTQQQQAPHHAGAGAAAAWSAPPRLLQQAAASGRGGADLLEEAARARAAAAEARLPCPRCRSRDTKFCYFNNYNVNQPRHFCKDCHRYWTAGGALRNVPVGAGRRKNRPLGPVVAAGAHLHHQHRVAAAAAGFVLGFPGGQHPSSPTSPSPVYADRWPVCPDRRF